MKTLFCFSLMICSGIAAAMAQTAGNLNLMPMPQSVQEQAGSFAFSNKFTIGLQGPASAKLTAAANRFYLALGRRTSIVFPQDFISEADYSRAAQLRITWHKSIEPVIGMDESYTLRVTPQQISLDAATDIGAERGLETLFQLITPEKNAFTCPDVNINDFPRFKWRGLMIDVARHFIPFEVLKRNIDAMAIVKMNVLHLHLSDDEGFRVESKMYPLLQQKGSNGQYYTQDQIRELVKYAHDRGIIVVPEFDLPGHCSALLAAYPFLASYKSDYKPSRRYKLDTVRNLNMATMMQFLAKTPTPTINPTKESTYTFFDKFLREMSGLFPDSFFHVGADENNGAAWKQNPAIMAFMKAKGMKNTDELQAYFVKRMYLIARKYHKQLIGWQEAFNPNLPQDAIVQQWKPAAPKDSLPVKIISHHNQLIVSAGYYLDIFYPAYIHYLNDPVSPLLSATQAQSGILGGEAALWSELVDGGNEEIRVWPRAAAIAERFWSAASVQDVDDMYRRLWATDFELNNRAIDEHNNYVRILARWVNDEDLSPVLTLTNVCTPVKGYRRLMGDVMFSKSGCGITLTTPLVNIADASHCDSETGWYFRQLVSDYLAKHDTADLQAIKSQLLRWQQNKARFDNLKYVTPYMQGISDLSDNLSAAAGIGLRALNNQGKKDGMLQQLKQMEAPLHEVQLAVLPEIEALVTGKLAPRPASYPMF